MAYCEKCGYDPCLCHLGGFGPDEDESTQEKDIKELQGRRVIVKSIPEYQNLLINSMKEPHPNLKELHDAYEEVKEELSNRPTDVTGKIDKIGGVMINSKPFALFYVLFDDLTNTNVEGQWYFDEELIYL
jgi:hypothetical protein